MSELNIHGTGLVLDGTGVVLRGKSGSGKSLLALLLLDAYAMRNRPALLVADDRLDILATDTGLEMRAPPRLAGLIELRGRGIVTRPFVEQAPLHLVIDLVDDLVRMQEDEAFLTELAGISLARAPVPRAGLVEAVHQRLLVEEAIAALQGRNHPQRQKTT
jgi:serine kinase of HPr protein (carbohydrate metabolism regulator)